MITFKWIDGKREPKVAANPKYPDGMDIDLSDGADRRCKTSLPHPAKRCGYYAVQCTRCSYAAIVTTAGRADDPRSVTLPCRKQL